MMTTPTPPVPQADAPSAPTLTSGAKVMVEGLQDNPKLNGVYGQLQQYDDNTGRWKLQLKAGSKYLSVRPSNLKHVSDEEYAASTVETAGCCSCLFGIFLMNFVLFF